MTTYDKLLNGRGLETVLRKLKTEIEIPREVFAGLYNVSGGKASLEGCTYSEIAESIVGRKVVVLYPVDTSEVNSIFYAYRPDTGIKNASVIFSTFPKIEGANVIVETLTVTSNSVLYEQTSTEKKIYTIDGEFSFEDPTEINTGFPQSIIQDVEDGKEVVISGTLAMIDEGDQPGPPQSVNPIAKSSPQLYSNVKYVAQYVTKESKNGVTRYYFDAFNVVETYSTGDFNRQPVALQFIVQSDKNNAVTCWAYELVDNIKFSSFSNSVIYREEVEPILYTGTTIAIVGGKTIYAPVSEEGIQSETDPIFSVSPAANITATDISRWNAITTSITSTLDSRYVNITGDTMTGPLEVESDDGYGMTMKSILEHDKLSFWHDYGLETPAATLSIGVDRWYGGIVLGVTNSTGATGTVGISGVATPSEEYDAANKIYVDETIDNVVYDAISAVTTTIPKETYAVDIQEGIESYRPVRDTYASIKEKLDAGVFVYGRTISAFEDGPLCSDIFITKYPGDSEPGQDSIEFTKFNYVEGYSASGYDAPCSISSTKFLFHEDGSFSYDHPNAVHSHVRADWAATIPNSPAFIENKPDLSTYVSKSAVISTGPTNGTAIANIGGVTIYAPVAQGGVTVERDPVFTGWATGSGIAAYTITASDVEKWNGITGYVPKEVTGGTITFIPSEFAVDIQDQNENLSSIAATTNSVEIWVGEGATESAAAMSMNIQNGSSHLDLNAQHLMISSNDTRITGVVTPTSNLGAANKLYVDSQINSVTTGLTNYVPKEVIDSTIATTITVGSDGFKVEAFTNNQENISSVSVNPVNGKIELTAGEYANEHYAGIELGGENGKSYIYMQANDVAISGVTTPTYPQDAANKKYVDDAISAVTTTVLDSGVLYADITGTTSLTSNVTYANIVAATPTKAVMLRRNGDIYQLAKAASSGLEFRVIKPLEIDEIVMTSSTITYNSYLTNVSGTTLTINE